MPFAPLRPECNREPRKIHEKKSASIPAAESQMTATTLHWEGHREPRELQYMKSASTQAMLPSLRIQQEVTEETEDRVRVRCLLFNRPALVSAERWNRATPERRHPPT